jgi:transposase-like protein
MTEKQSYRHFTAKEKYDILKEGEYGSMTINEVCRKNRISTTQYYQWRKHAREAMLAGLENKPRRNKKNHKEEELIEQNERLKATLLEITQENVELKKKNLR